jgi:DNA invertase Pin-like site-specific DNA recombinase
MDTPLRHKALGYVRVSSLKQSENPRYNYQEEIIRKYADSRGWDIEIIKETRSGRDIAHRPILLDTLKRLEEKQASRLIVLSVDRLTRNTADALHILDLSKKQGWQIYPLSLVPDHYPEADWLRGFTFEAATARHELDVLSARTKQGIQMSKNRQAWGPARHSEQVLHRVKYLRERKKLTFAKIADVLNKEDVPITRPSHASIQAWTKDKALSAYRSAIELHVS